MGRKEQAARSRAELVEAARQCFTERGYEATTVAAILDRAGMARGALYHYFPDGKRQLFTAVFEVINEDYHRRRDAAATIPSPLARIRAAMHAFLDLCREDDFARIALVDAPRLVPGQAERGTSYALLREQLEAAKRAGETRPFHVEAMALALYGAVRTAGEHVMTANDRRRAARAAKQAIDVLLDGIEADARGRNVQ